MDIDEIQQRVQIPKQDEETVREYVDRLANEADVDTQLAETVADTLTQQLYAKDADSVSIDEDVLSEFISAVEANTDTDQSAEPESENADQIPEQQTQSQPTQSQTPTSVERTTTVASSSTAVTQSD